MDMVEQLFFWQPPPAEDALVEYRRDGGESASSFFGSLAAETKATYEPDEA